MVEAREESLSSLIKSLAIGSPYFRMLGRVAGQYHDITVDSDLEWAILQGEMSKGEVFRRLTDGRGNGAQHASGKSDGELRPARHVSGRKNARHKNEMMASFINRESSRR